MIENTEIKSIMHLEKPIRLALAIIYDNLGTFNVTLLEVNSFAASLVKHEKYSPSYFQRAVQANQVRRQAKEFLMHEPAFKETKDKYKALDELRNNLEEVVQSFNNGSIEKLQINLLNF